MAFAELTGLVANRKGKFRLTQLHVAYEKAVDAIESGITDQYKLAQ